MTGCEPLPSAVSTAIEQAIDLADLRIAVYCETTADGAQMFRAGSSRAGHPHVQHGRFWHPARSAAS